MAEVVHPEDRHQPGLPGRQYRDHYHLGRGRAAEGNRDPDARHRAVGPGRPASATRFNHYSLLRTTEELLGITTFLSHAGDPGTRSMRADFNI